MNFRLITSRYKNSIGLFLSFILIALKSNAQEKITLQQAIETTLKSNLQIKQAQLTEALTEETLKQSQLALYPNLNSNNSVGTNWGRSIDPTTNSFVNSNFKSGNVNLISEATVFQGFQKLRQISQNKFLLEADKSNTQKIRNDLTLAVIDNYLQVLSNQDILLTAQQQLDMSKQKLDREQQLFDAGNKTFADLSQAKAQVAASELNQTNAQNKLDFSFLTLAQLLERDPAIPFLVEKPLIEAEKAAAKEYTAVDVYRQALKTFPEIQSAQFKSLAAEKAINLAQGNLYPRLTIQGALNTRFSSQDRRLLSQYLDPATLKPVSVYENTPLGIQVKDNFSQSLALGINIPIFNGFSARSTIKRAKINHEQALVSEQLAKNNLNKVINQAVLDVRAAEKKYNSTNAAYLASKDAFDTIEKRYQVGLVNAIDFNKAQTDMNNAQFDFIKSEYDLLFRHKAIDFYLGKCLASNDCK